MSQVDAETNQWAILIGVNFYKGMPLKGCVRDVELMKQWFGYNHYIGSEARIVTLTATTPDNPDSCYPTETPDSWPTYENVTSSLKNTTAQAKPGASVYIHFSGYGVRTEDPSASSNRNQNSGDIALVLFDTARGCSYLLGQELANRLNDMVKKGLLVTLVLDCGFSGSAVPHGSPYDDSIGAISSRSSLRDARTLPEWLINPDGYTILTACGPHEQAANITLSDGEKTGAFSYLLVSALHSFSKSGTEITHQSLYQRLCDQFHANWPRQTPMCYGNKHLPVFGKPRPSLDAAFNPVSEISKHNRLQPGAGYTHSVREGDEFAIYSFDSPASVGAPTDSGYASQSRAEGLIPRIKRNEASDLNKDDDVEYLQDNDTQSIDSDISDIRSEVSQETTPVENEGKAYLAEFLACDQELGPLCSRVLSRMDRARFTNTVQKLLYNPYYQSLLQDAATEREQKSVRLLRRRRGRLQIGEMIANIIERDDDEDAGKTRNHDEEMKKIRAEELNNWLTDLNTTVNRQSGEQEHYHDYFLTEDGDLEIEREEVELPHLAEIESFFRSPGPFQRLLNEFKKLLLPRLLKQVVQSIPRGRIWLSRQQNQSLINRTKAFIEDYTQLEWDWWPLKPRMQLLRDNETRLLWQCVSIIRIVSGL